MGSVKDVEVIRKASEREAGEGVFTFSDRYSAFDWGEMPDHIEKKGAALCMMAAFNLEKLEENGVKTHYLGLLDGKGNTVKTGDFVKKGVYGNKMRFKMVQVLPPDDDYCAYEKKNDNYLIPLEIVFRNGLPEGSSVFKKIAAAKKSGTLPETLKALGLDREPTPGEMLPFPVYDFWTKLESTDRALSREEAKRISGLGERFGELEEIAAKVNSIVTAQAEKQGMVHYDGKIECAYLNGEIIVCDTVGTLDEDRFGFQGIQISKQILRNAYLKTQWYKDLEEAKKKVGREGDLQEICKSKPEPLLRQFVELASQTYQSACNQYTGEKIFGVPSLAELTKKLSTYKF